VIDYKGKRLHAQCIVPGFAQPSESEMQIAFGSIDNGQHFFFNEEVKERMDALTNALHLQPHTIVDGEGKTHRIACPADVKVPRILMSRASPLICNRVCLEMTKDFMRLTLFV